MGEEKSEVEPTRKTEKSGEGKADAFFKRNGTIIIQLVHISMSLIGCIVGFSYSVAVTDYLPVYMLAVMFVSVFFIAGILMFCVFVKPGGTTIKILKIILLVLCFGSAMTYFGLLKAFDDFPDVSDYIGFFIFSGASYAVLSIAILLNILVEFRVIKSNTKIEMEKSIFIPLVCALVFAICLFVANITVCSYAYYEEYDHFQWLLENDESYDWWYY